MSRIIWLYLDITYPLVLTIESPASRKFPFVAPAMIDTITLFEAEYIQNV